MREGEDGHQRARAPQPVVFGSGVFQRMRIFVFIVWKSHRRTETARTMALPCPHPPPLLTKTLVLPGNLASELGAAHQGSPLGLEDRCFGEWCHQE